VADKYNFLEIRNKFYDSIPKWWKPNKLLRSSRLQKMNLDELYDHTHT
jgi:hypothetical protein